MAGYDNERGKGDHKHIGGKKQVYAFQSVDQLPEDFRNDVKGVVLNERRVLHIEISSPDERL
ncbi:MAG: DUF6516 family protein [Pseudomonadota bacterium]